MKCSLRLNNCQQAIWNDWTQSENESNLNSLNKMHALSVVIYPPKTLTDLHKTESEVGEELSTETST